MPPVFGSSRRCRPVAWEPGQSQDQEQISALTPNTLPWPQALLTCSVSHLSVTTQGVTSIGRQPPHPAVRGSSSSSGTLGRGFGNGGRCLSQQSEIITAVTPQAAGGAAPPLPRRPPRDIPGCPMRLQAGFSEAQGNSPPSSPVCCLNRNKRSLPSSPKHY